MSPTPAIRRPEIDGLRAIAVLAVIFFQLGTHGFGGGFVGVDIFFVISGYLITGIIKRQTDDDRFSLVDFYIRRARRILPALTVIVAASLVVGFAVMTPEDYRKLGISALFALGFSSNVLFWQEAGYFDTASILKPLLHTWSLGIEEQFYLVWPIAFVAALRLRVAKLFVLACIVGSLVLLMLFHQRSSAVFYLTPFRVFELAIGAALVWLPTLHGRWAGLATGTGMACIAWAIAFTQPDGFPSLVALAPCLGAALVIVGGPSAVAIPLTNRIATYIGGISYSLYLVHWPMLSFWAYAIRRDFSATEQIALLAAAFVAADQMRRHIELPFIKGRSLRTLFAATLGAAVLSVTVVVSAGLPLRLDVTGGMATATPPVYGGQQCEGMRCESNPGAQKTVYLIGDSYLRAMYAGFVASFPGINFISFENGGCQMYSLRYLGAVMADPQGCIKARDAAFAEIRGTEHPVIVSQHWEANFTSTQRLADDSDEHFSLVTPAAYAEFVVRELKDLDHWTNGKLLVVGGVPKYGDMNNVLKAKMTPYDCLMRPFSADNCAVSSRLDAIRSGHAAINSALKAELPGGISFIDPYDAMCDPAQCRNVDESGISLYYDYGHLSEVGAVYLVSAVSGEIEAWLAAVLP